MKEYFDEATRPRLQPQPEQQATQPMPPQETPKFFQPRPALERLDEPMAAVVSAPVSRGVPQGGDRQATQIDPRRVSLSPVEREIARSAGISELEYAKQKIKLSRMKATGQVQ
jgi:hypothetical protein